MAKDTKTTRLEAAHELRAACLALKAGLDTLLATVERPEGPFAPTALGDFDGVLRALRETVASCADVAVQLFAIPGRPRVALVVVTSLVPETALAPAILVPLTTRLAETLRRLGRGGEPAVSVWRDLLRGTQVEEVDTYQDLATAILGGKAVLLTEGRSAAVTVTVGSPEARPVSTTTVENVLRGPLDAFTETLSVNLGLVRKRVRDTRLRVEYQRVGRSHGTHCALLFIADRAEPGVVDRVRESLRAVTADTITDSGELMQHMTPGWLHVFPLAVSTERPDRVVQGLYDGRVAIIVNNSPFVLLLPSAYVDFFRTAEDLYLPWVPASFVRFARLISDHVTALAPALYVCFAAYNPDILSPPFLQALAGARALVPYSPLVEAFLVLLLTDILVEATIRSPKAVGNAIPIVGGIIIGDVLVSTHLASDVMLVLGALSAITQFTATEPSIQVVERINKYWFVAAAGLLGFLGLMGAAAVELAYLASLDSAGIPYFHPVAPFKPRETLNSKFVLPPRWRPKRSTRATVQ